MNVSGKGVGVGVGLGVGVAEGDAEGLTRGAGPGHPLKSNARAATAQTGIESLEGKTTLMSNVRVQEKN